MLGTSTALSGRRTAGVVVSGAYLVLVLMNFAWFWPIWTDQLLTHGEWLDRIWFTRWI
jgi:dolichyl-phosphate-mannose-protein mannosyltransferase